ncbi:MAG: hypothetical protein HYW26_03025 [Candidatus Aenigmarchaeota archaeon]|nr:hypothetical protein [Candidatus Aenigmarchaeota archaeon]
MDKKYLIAFLITSLVFVSGLFIGSKITASRTEEIQRTLQNDLLDFQSLELELSLIKNTNACDYIGYRLPDVIKRKVDLGRKFDIGDIPKEEAKTLQKQYVISLMRYWFFSEVQEEQCNITTPRVIFFFDESEISREQGRVLDYLVYRSNESISVFAFNREWEEPIIRLLMANYQVNATPAIVINGTKYEGLQTREKVQQILCSSYERLC